MGKPDRIDEKVRAFDNPVLERLSRIHPAIPVCMWGPVALGAIYLGIRAEMTVSRVIGFVIVGFAVPALRHDPGATKG